MTIESHRKAQFKYSHSKKGKKKRQDWCIKNKKESDAEYYQKNKEQLKKQTLAYKRTLNGKLTILRHYYKRHKNFTTILMFPNPFDESEVIDWHHINDAYVVAIPRDLHRHYQGKYHREKVMDIVKQIYLGDLV